MKTVFKYDLPIESRFSVELPKGAVILSGQIQDGKPVFWAEVDPDASKTARTLFIVGTGHPIAGAPFRYINTFQDGPYVWHFYEQS